MTPSLSLILATPTQLSEVIRHKRLVTVYIAGVPEARGTITDHNAETITLIDDESGEIVRFLRDNVEIRLMPKRPRLILR